MYFFITLVFNRRWYFDNCFATTYAAIVDKFFLLATVEGTVELVSLLMSVIILN